jgi:hypothetical protein
MNGFDLLLLAMLTAVGGVLHIAKGRGRLACAARSPGRQPSCRKTDRMPDDTVQHAHTMAGVRWLVTSALALLLAVTRERDTMFLVAHWENVLMPCLVLTTAWVITNARADRAGWKAVRERRVHGAGGETAAVKPAGADPNRLARLKRTLTMTRLGAKAEGPSAGHAASPLSHIMQCPEDSFWQGW